MMLDALTENFTPLSAIIAAVLGAAILFLTTYYSSRKSARIELSKLRLDWIEKLREDLSEFQAMAMRPDFRPHEDERFYRLGTRIELRLNPSEADHAQLIAAMYDMLRASEGSLEDKYKTNPLFVSTAQKIIKDEWARVRKGIV